jgi:hypothetical protein
LQTLAGEQFEFAGSKLVYHGFSNTFFMIKVLSALNVLTGSSLLLNSLYLTLAGFLGCWYLVKVLCAVFPGTRGAAVCSILLWPSAVYWTSGITKESLLVASGAGLLAVVVRCLYGGPVRRPWLLAALGFGLAVLQFKMRFFFAAALFAAVAGLLFVRTAQWLGWARQRWVQVSLFVGLLVGGMWLASEISPVFRFNKFASQLTRTYSELRIKSLGRPHIGLPNLAPTAESIALYTPKAVASALYRPFIWEGDTLSYGAAALENVLLLAISILALADVVRRRNGPLPFALVMTLLVYCLLLAALLGLSTPNLGTMNRYRSPWLPILVYLMLCQATAAGSLRRLQEAGLR